MHPKRICKDFEIYMNIMICILKVIHYFWPMFSKTSEKFVQFQYPEKLHELHHDLAFLPERIKIEKVKNLVTNLHDKTEYDTHTRNIKEVLNHELVFKKYHRITKINQNLG